MQLELTEAEWRDLAVVCQMWLDEHPNGVPLCRRIAHRMADWYTYQQPQSGRRPACVLWSDHDHSACDDAVCRRVPQSGR